MHDSSIIDLHCHSTASDGTYAPKEVAALAQKIGLSAIALTDHDTIDGLAEFQAAGNALGIEAIAGIEFAALWEHFHRPEIHIVGLGFDPAHPVLKGRMETIRSSRDIRNRRMCERLSSIGLHLPLVSLICTALSAAAAGYDWAACKRKRGLLWGALAGLVYTALLYVITSLAADSFVLHASGLMTLAVALAAGVIGGILGVNRR